MKIFRLPFLALAYLTCATCNLDAYSSHFSLSPIGMTHSEFSNKIKACAASRYLKRRLAAAVMVGCANQCIDDNTIEFVLKRLLNDSNWGVLSDLLQSCDEYITGDRLRLVRRELVRFRKRVKNSKNIPNEYRVYFLGVSEELLRRSAENEPTEKGQQFLTKGSDTWK